MTKTVKAHLALFLVNAMYAASHILAKGIMPFFLTPTVFIALRVVGSTFLFWLVKCFLPLEKIERQDWVRLAFCGLFGVTVNQLFFFHGLNLSSSINAGIIMTTNPIMVFILSMLFLKEKITALKSIGLLLGTSGAILLSLRGTGQTESNILGDIFLFINALSYAVYLILAKPLMKKYSPITVITWVFTFGTIFILLLPSVYTEFGNTPFDLFTSEIIAKIIFVVVGVTFLTYLLTMFGLKYLSATVSSAYIYFQPLLVFVFAWVFLFLDISEDYTKSITLDKFIYMGLIILGVRMISYRGKKAI